MIIHEAENLVKCLVREYLGDEWKVELFRSRTKIALCGGSAHRKIWVSAPFLEVNDSDFAVTVAKHEIAHALVGSFHLHDRVWKAKAIELGIAPFATLKCNSPNGRWYAVCPVCRRTIYRYSKPRSLSGFLHTDCGPQAHLVFGETR